MNNDLAAEQIWFREALGAIQSANRLITRLTPTRQRKLALDLATPRNIELLRNISQQKKCR